MIDPDLARRLKVLVTTTAVVYVVLVSFSTVILGLSLPGPSGPVRATKGTATSDRGRDWVPPPATGDIEGRVHDIFGDPVPAPKVRVDACTVRGDGEGRFHVFDVSVGNHEIRIEADGYRPRTFSYTVTEGQNAPRIKYETGLWPTEFALDFHIFFDHNNPAKLYGVVGLANPTKEPIYITDMRVESTDGEIIQDFLGDLEGYQDLVLSYPQLQLTLDPRPAVILPPRGSVGHIELKPFAPEPVDPPRSYRAVVLYAHGAAHQQGNHKKAVKEAAPRPEDDYNPHSP